MLEPEARDRPGSTMRQQIILLPPWRRCLPPPPLPYGASRRQQQWQPGSAAAICSGGRGQLQPSAVAAGVSCSHLQWRPGSAAVSDCCWRRRGTGSVFKVRVPGARLRREDYCCLLLSRAELIFSYTERERSGRALILLRYSSALLMRVMSRR